MNDSTPTGKQCSSKSKLQTVKSHFLGASIFLFSSAVVAGACSTASVEPGVMGVFEDGYIEINDGNVSSFKESSDLCKVTFGGSSSTVNVSSDNYMGSEKSDCGITASDSNVGTLSSLPTFVGTTDTRDFKIKNSSAQITIDGANYKQDSGQWKYSGSYYTSVGSVTFPDLSVSGDYVYFTNDDWQDVVVDTTSHAAYFAYDNSKDPYHIRELNVANGAKIILEPGEYFLDALEVDSSYLEVAAYDTSGNALGDGSGKVKLYIRNLEAYGSKIFNNGACINFDGCTVSSSSVDPTNQHPERLAIYVYEDEFTLYDRNKVAASLYAVSGPIIIRSNSGFTFVGEMLASDISVLNNSGVTLYYEDTGSFAELYSTEDTSREGEYSLASSGVAAETSTGDYTYVPSQTDNTDESGITGHLKAFALKADGTTTSTASWDANALMTADDRKARLWSTDSSGSLVLFNSLDDAAFGMGTVTSLISDLSLSTSASVALIKNYTIYPNYDSGAYLGDRDSSSMMGAPYITQPVVMGGIVVFQTDDGFVYAVDSSSGALKWGFIPRPLVAELQNYEDFYGTHSMAGQIATLNSGSDATAGYIVGSAMGGDMHYALQVDSSGSLTDVLWVDETSSNLAHSPILMYVGSTPYAVYATGTQSITARSLASSYSETTYDVSSKLEDSDSILTAAPMAHVEYELDTSGKARVQEGDIYLGDNDGFVYYAPLVSSGSLVSTTKLRTNMDTLGNVGTSSDVSENVLYLEHATETEAEYVTAQTSLRLKTFRLPSDETSYLENWTSYNSGSGYWDETGSTYTPETTFSPNTEHIQKLPSTATITAKATIAASVVFLPVQIETEDECSAYYYLYQLADGYFPINTIYSSDVVEDNVKVGNGESFQASVMVHNGDVVVQGGSETNNSEILGVDDSFTFTISPGGRSGWREVSGE